MAIYVLGMSEYSRTGTRAVVDGYLRSGLQMDDANYALRPGQVRSSRFSWLIGDANKIERVLLGQEPEF